ncbi:GcrA family cell cycle regulator [Xanthobacter autotrophicus]|uniref:GcrA family cell cycle regulator n=1 Tax=Xanthobacter autotrophicus TaxID=280 RepID=UPI00372A1E74
MSEDTGHRRLLIDGERLHCRWPVDGASAELMTCGDLVRDGTPYCEVHHALAYVPPPWRTVSVGGAPRGVVRKVSDAATGAAAGAVNGLAVTINAVARRLEAAARRGG